jgi:hypothetical protein
MGGEAGAARAGYFPRRQRSVENDDACRIPAPPDAHTILRENPSRWYGSSFLRVSSPRGGLAEALFCGGRPDRGEGHILSRT